MKVILLSEVKGKGGEGDVVDVTRGFANNYLLPQGKAIVATPGNLKQLEQRKSNIAKREETRLADAEARKAMLEGLTVRVEATVGEEGQLFGSVTTAMIADALEKATETEIDKRRIELSKPIKTAGEHQVMISIYRDIKAEVKLLVGNEASFAALDAAAEAGEAAEEAAEVAEEAVEAVEAVAEEAAEVVEAAAEEAAEAVEEVAEAVEEAAEEVAEA